VWANNPTKDTVRCLEGLSNANSYAVNIGIWGEVFRTAYHIDPNNRKNSPSVIVFAGENYAGGYYMMPQFGLAFGSQPGAVMIHFSADPDQHIGFHATSDTFFTE
jgi:hypothetical protein